MLGTTIGTLQTDRFNSFKRDAFGSLFANTANNEYNMFTGKPEVAGLGYAFLFRNYRANLGKWQTSDPLGYPNGWNNLAYVNNGVTSAIDWLEGAEVWIKNNVAWIENKIPYGVVSGSAVGNALGTSILIVWEIKIHATCRICLHDEYKIIYRSTIINNSPWNAVKIASSPATSSADVVAFLISETVTALIDSSNLRAIGESDMTGSQDIRLLLAKSCQKTLFQKKRSIGKTLR